MSSKWMKALLIVLLTWAVLLAGQSLLQSKAFSISLPNLIGIGNVAAEKNESLVHTIDANDALTELAVESTNGRMTLIGSDDQSNVTIQAHYRARAASQGAANKKLEQMSTLLVQEGERLVVRAVFGNKTRESIDYTVTLPRALLVQAKTSNGNLVAEELTGIVSLNTSNGRIIVSSEQGPQELVARTSNGGITVRANPTGDHYNLRTSNGAIIVELPEHLGVSLNARTSNGSINLTTGEWSFAGGKLSKNQVEASRGDGQLDLTVTTSNGSITLQDR